MKFVYVIYIFIVIFVRNKEKLLARCIEDLGENELVHLSQKLNALECVKLVQAAYELIPTRVKHKAKKLGLLSENLTPISTSPEECFLNLEQWCNDFPKTMKLGGRAAMEMTLRWLGRPDLAKYVRDGHGSIKFLDKEDDDIAEAIEFPEHAVLKRHTSRIDEQRSTNGNKKSKVKANRRHHKEVQKAIGAAKVHAVAKKTRQLKKKEDNCPNSVARQSICWSIFFISLFIAVCLLIAYFLYKRKHSKARGTRFKYNRNGIKEDKDTFTDYLEWEDEICSCSDIEGGCTGKCPMCSRNDKTQPAATYRTVSDDSVEDFNGNRKMKKRKERKRQRFSFLQRTFQNKKKEKDQENHDRKNTLEKSDGKKHEKAPIILSKDQCVCCRCALNTRDKMIREKKENEKRELNRWKAKKKKEERRRKKEESRKVDRHANVCYTETCK